MPLDKMHEVVVGVDGSSDAMHAASIGSHIAQRAEGHLHLVHATRDLWMTARQAITAAASSISSSSPPIVDSIAIETAHSNLATDLSRRLPNNVPPKIQVESGRAGPALARVARDKEASLIVIGGKHHTTFGRWLAGSTAHYLARNAPCPTLVTTSGAETFSRILVALDQSDHAGNVLKSAEKLAQTVHGALRVLHVVKDGDRVDSGDGRIPTDGMRESQHIIDELIYEYAHVGAESLLVRGEIWPVIQSEIRHWDADVLVVGSHGSGFEERQLLGRISEACLHDLPTSTLFVPVRKGRG